MKGLKFFSLAVAGVMLTACSSEEPGAPVNGAEDGYVNYIKVNIVQPTGTRAAEDAAYVDGEGQENEVKNALFAFYNGNGDKVGQTFVDSPAFTSQDPTNDNVEKLCSATVLTNLKDGAQGYVVCYLNVQEGSQAPATMYTGSSISKIQALNALETESGEKASFVMSNSVYYDAEGNLQTGAKLGKIFSTKEAADAAVDAADITDIYVERVAAKVRVAQGGSFVLKDAPQEGYVKAADGTEVSSFTFEPAGWFISAEAKKSYTVKRFFKSGSQNLLFAEAGNLLNEAFAGEWNHAANHRSYWATPLNYYNGLYASNKGEVSTEGSLNYYSWSTTATQFGDNNWNYCLEQASKNALNFNEFTGVVVKGQYKLNGEATTFYTYGFAEKDGKIVAALYTNEDKLWEQLIANLNVKKDGAKATVADAKAAFELTADPEHTGKVLVTIKKDGNTSGITVNNNAVSAAALTEVLKTLPSISKYTDGMAYYWVPIHQFSLSNDEVVAGTYGVIRNHAYDIQINAVGGLAMPVTDPDEPIVPENPETANYLKASIKMLAWRLMPKQDTTLGK